MVLANNPLEDTNNIVNTWQMFGYCTKLWIRNYIPTSTFYINNVFDKHNIIFIIYAVNTWYINVPTYRKYENNYVGIRFVELF